MLWIAFTAQLAMAEPIGTYSWFRVDDFPFSVLMDESVRRVNYRATVRPDGKLLKCEIENTSGLRDVDALTCRLVRKRGRFKRAKWIDGTPAYGVYRSGTTWAVDGGATSYIPSDIDMVVQKLPKGVESQVLVSVMFAADADGHPSNCMEAPPIDKKSPPDNSALVRAACKQLLANYTAIPAKDATGKAVPSVQNASARFILPKK